jgi:hypothetical protein
VRGVTVGGPDHVAKEDLGPGTPGWTDSYFAGAVPSGDGELAAFELPDAAFAFAGLVVAVDDQLVELPTEDKAVAHEDLPEKLSAVLP